MCFTAFVPGADPDVDAVLGTGEGSTVYLPETFRFFVGRRECAAPSAESMVGAVRFLPLLRSCVAVEASASTVVSLGAIGTDREGPATALGAGVRDL